MTTHTPSRPHRIHASLFRPVLFLGIAPNLAVLEVAAVCAIAFLVGLHLLTLVLIALVLFVLHPLAVWVTQQDPSMLAIYARSLSIRDFYVPHAPPWTTAPSLHPSIPMTSSS